jgi:FkbM family methyltransferase
MQWVILAIVAFLAIRIVRMLARRHQKRTFREYGYVIEQHDLGRYGTMEFARWLHPRVKPETFSEAEVDGLREYVSEGDFVIDIGAHMGDTTVPLAYAAGKTGTTLAIEPNRYVYKILEANAGLNKDKTNIVPGCYAVTDEDGRYTFLYSDASFCNGGNLGSIADQSHRHEYPLEVEGRRLETILRRDFADKLDRLSYVKIDAEGYDKDIIASIADILREFKPVLVTEVLKKLNDDERDQMYDIIRSCGYELFQHTRSRPLKGEPIDRDTMKTLRHFDILALPEGHGDTR